MADSNEYDEIFAALKHPVRRQILLFIERKNEASFTDIQEETGISDTGLMSYHLKELSPLLEQSKRGKYCLSEVGQAGVVLFRKVERERQKTSTVVRGEVEKYFAETIKKSVFLLCIVGFILGVSMCIDILMSVQGVLGIGYSIFQLAGLFLLSSLVMITGGFLFVVYDRHYYFKTIRTSFIHSAAFAIAISVISIPSVYNIYLFNQQTLAVSGSHSIENFSLSFGFLRIIVFFVGTIIIAYGLNKFSVHRKDKP